MTQQEIIAFVNQPIPRNVPLSILHAEIDKHNNYLSKNTLFYLVFCVFFIVPIISITMFCISDILLDLNIGNKKTVHGVIISISRVHDRKEYYILSIRFSTQNGDIKANCHVDYKNEIPGWGLIPETLYNNDHLDHVYLKKPFPVTIEYIPWYPSGARIVKTRSSPFSYFSVFVFIVIIAVAVSMTFVHLKRSRMNKRLLTEGLFANGHIFEPTKQRKNLFQLFESIFQGKNSLSFAFLFIDPSGVKRKGSCIVSKHTFSLCKTWINEERTFGLLYLSDQEEVIITDLWLNRV